MGNAYLLICSSTYKNYQTLFTLTNNEIIRIKIRIPLNLETSYCRLSVKSKFIGYFQTHIINTIYKMAVISHFHQNGYSNVVVNDAILDSLPSLDA